jgi:hypothetical protein
LQREAKKLADENKILAVQLKAAMKVYDSSLVLTSMLNFHCWLWEIFSNMLPSLPTCERTLTLHIEYVECLTVLLSIIGFEYQ